MTNKKNDNKDVMLGKLADEYLVKVKAGEKISINEWVAKHKDVVPPDELKDQLRMGVLLTKVGQEARPRPTLTAEKRNNIKTNTLTYYEQVMGGKKAAPQEADSKLAYDYLDKAADTFGKQDYPATRELLTKSMAIHEKTGNKVWLGFEHSIMGLMAQVEDKLDEAIEHYRKSGQYYQDARQPKAQAAVLSYLALAYLERNDYDKSRQFYEKVMAISEKINLHSGIANAAINLGVIELAQGNYKRSFSLTQKALEIAETAGDKSTIAIAYANMGEAAENGRGHKEAIELYHKALAIARQIKDYHLISNTAGVLGALYASHNKRDEAAECFNEALAAIDELRGASKHPAAVTFRRAMGSVGLQSQDEVLTDFRRRLKETQLV